MKFLDDNLFNIPDTTHRSQASTKQQTAGKPSEDDKEKNLMIIDKKEDQEIQKKSDLSGDISSSLDGDIKVIKNKSPILMNQAFIKMNSAKYSNGEDLQDIIDARNSENGDLSQIRRERKLYTGEPIYQDNLQFPNQDRAKQNSANTDRSGDQKKKFFHKNLPLLTVSKANDLPSYSGIESPNQLSSSSNQHPNQNEAKRHSKKSAEFKRQESLSVFNRQISFKDNLSKIDGQDANNIGSNSKFETLSKIATPTSGRLGRDIIKIIEDHGFDSNEEEGKEESEFEFDGKLKKAENLKTEGN